MTEADDTPTFTIKATDRLACATIQCWISMAKFAHVKAEKIASAENVLMHAKEWQALNAHKVKCAD